VKIDIEYPYLCKDRDRHGNVRFYFRRKGHKKIRIKARPGTAEFQAAYDAAKAESDGKALHMPPSEPGPKVGTLRWLCIRYIGSTDSSSLTPRPRRYDAVSLTTFAKNRSRPA
jgi:hypothetical protein